MRLLLDTPILIWWLADDLLLSAPSRAAIADPASDIFVSAATVWEIAIKGAKKAKGGVNQQRRGGAERAEPH